MKNRKKIWVPITEMYTSFGKDRFYEETVDFDGMTVEQAITRLTEIQKKYTDNFESIAIEEVTEYGIYPGDSDRKYLRFQGYREMNDAEIAKEKADNDARIKNYEDMERRQYEQLKAKFEKENKSV